MPNLPATADPAASVAVTDPDTGWFVCQNVPVTGNTPSLDGAIESEFADVLMPSVDGSFADAAERVASVAAPDGNGSEATLTG